MTKAEGFEFQYEEDLEIDPDALDTEWMNQPRLYQRYAEQLAIADREAKHRKEKMDTKRAELTLQAHMDGIDGLEKLTEAKVSAWIQTHPEYQAVKEDLIEAEYEAQLLKGAVMAFSQRKNALENLVILHGQQYFASPKLPRDLAGEWEKKMKESRTEKRMEKQATQMRKRRSRNGK